MEDAQAMQPKAQQGAFSPPAAERRNPTAAEHETHDHARGTKRQAHAPRHLKHMSR